MAPCGYCIIFWFSVWTDQDSQGHSFAANVYVKYRSNGLRLIYFLLSLLLCVINLGLTVIIYLLF
jgi:hypothetical protein